MYHCDQCDKMYKDAEKLLQHKNFMHSNGSSFVCLECSEGFRLQRQLAKHRKTHIYTCNLCNRRFGLVEMLEFHGKTVHPEEWDYECPLCHAIFKTEENLCDHVKELHSPVYPCDLCKETLQLLKVFETKGQLSTHKLAVHNSQVNPCLICGKVFEKPDKLKQHKMSHRYKERHEKSHTNKTKKWYEAYSSHKDALECPLCPELFGSKNALKLHCKQVHKRHLCMQCMKSFKYKTRLKTHYRSHKKDDSPMRMNEKNHEYNCIYVCYKCGKAVRTTHALKLHMEMHDRARPYKCDICDKRFATYCKLTIHIRIHMSTNDEDPLACNS